MEQPVTAPQKETPVHGSGCQHPAAERESSSSTAIWDREDGEKVIGGVTPTNKTNSLFLRLPSYSHRVKSSHYYPAANNPIAII